ncbi:transcription termination factor 1 [Hemicordylus capensis]|uniref:transcription termination factor 1 n=1 Tax=Hemicordylus capensis TaxID=884348 RepID=UPI002303883B|nr:transcription termination factor 1 [Hemicordylus capensis]XP_053137945.1 transcription termination factor 1 [Hemicordylus capensis]XP_053137946.1 transcription termination factor 1 [Hemicordylus capensis]XP_053137947.1 transcription termination factor 1 [Hemicordylus capensis]XP_053137948.1 transcription termination factor 1 [Hemicordylus capensis]
MAEESFTNSFQILDPVKKKKKGKRKRTSSKEHDGEMGELSMEISDVSSVFPGHIEDQAAEDSRARQKKKKKKKAGEERSDSQLNSSLVTTESEVNNQAGAGLALCEEEEEKKKKKKKKKLFSLNTQDGGGDLSDAVNPGEADILSQADNWENVGQVSEGTPVKKRKKKKAKGLLTGQDEASKPIPGHTSGQEPSGHSSAEDTKEELLEPSPLPPLKKQPSSRLSWKKTQRRTNADAPGELSSPVVQKKLVVDRKSSSAEDSDATDVGFAVAGRAKGVADDDGSRPNKLRPRSKSGLLKSVAPVNKDEKGLAAAVSQDLSLLDNELLEYSLLPPLESLERAIEELEEFIPHVRTFSASAIKRLATRDLPRFKNFKEKGVAVKFGKFSRKENEQLKKNVEAFLEVSGIESAEKLLFTHRFPKEKAAIKKLKVENLFGVKIAERIPRPWRLVYYRARKMFDPHNRNRRYSEREKRELKKYHALYGNDWKKISGLMDRSSHSLEMKFSEIKGEPKSGPWSRAETKKLVEAVEEVLKSKLKRLEEGGEEEEADRALELRREYLYKGIPWSQVEAKVGTRHRKQCTKKWTSFVTKKMSHWKTGGQRPEHLQGKINLIERMYRLNIQDACEIDWEELSSAMGDVPPDYVRERFYKLKACHVPHWNQKAFPEIIDYLYEVTLPKLKELQMKKKEATESLLESSQTQDSTKKRVFQFSDIFQLSEEELSSESDECNTEI